LETSPTLDAALRVVARYSRYSAAVGVVPLPGLNLLAFGGLQLRMIAALCKHYTVPFSSRLGRSLIATLIGSAATTRVAIAMVPVLGYATGPILGYTATWAIGRVFVRHFESGGTLANFNAPDKAGELQKEIYTAPAGES